MKNYKYASEVVVGDSLRVNKNIEKIVNVKAVTQNTYEFTTTNNKKLLFGKSVRVYLEVYNG